MNIDWDSDQLGDVILILNQAQRLWDHQAFSTVDATRTKEIRVLLNRACADITSVLSDFDPDPEQLLAEFKRDVQSVYQGKVGGDVEIILRHRPTGESVVKTVEREDATTGYLAHIENEMCKELFQKVGTPDDGVDY